MAHLQAVYVLTAVCFLHSMLLTMNLEILGENQRNRDFAFSYKEQVLNNQAFTGPIFAGLPAHSWKASLSFL